MIYFSEPQNSDHGLVEDLRTVHIGLRATTVNHSPGCDATALNVCLCVLDVIKSCAQGALFRAVEPEC